MVNAFCQNSHEDKCQRTIKTTGGEVTVNIHEYGDKGSRCDHSSLHLALIRIPDGRFLGER